MFLVLGHRPRSLIKLFGSECTCQARFYRSVAITGEAYFLASLAIRNLYYTKKAAKNGNIVQPDLGLA